MFNLRTLFQNFRHVRRAPQRLGTLGKIVTTTSAVASTVIGIAACGPRDARQQFSRGDITISHVYLVSTMQDVPAALYFTIQNKGTVADTLTTVRVSDVDQVDLHQTMSSMPHGNGHTAHDMATMRTTMVPITNIPVPAHGELRFAPGGRHVMLSGMRRDFKPGDSTSAEVAFVRAGGVRVWARVIDYAQLDTLVRSAHSAGTPSP